MQNYIDQAKARFASRSSKHVIGFLLISFVALVSFSLGTQAGYNRAAFAYKFGDNYYQAFGPAKLKHGMGMIPSDRGMNAHGAVGRIVSVQLPTILVSDEVGIEKMIRTNELTLVRQQKQLIPLATLKSGDFIVTVGSPNEASEIEAKLIRLLPTQN